MTRDNYYYLATVHLLLGNLDQAVESVDRYLTEQKEWTAAFIRVDPIMEPLRELPEFQAVLENHSN